MLGLATWELEAASTAGPGSAGLAFSALLSGALSQFSSQLTMGTWQLWESDPM